MRPHYYHSSRNKAPTPPRTFRGKWLVLLFVAIIVVAFGADYLLGGNKAAAPGATTKITLASNKTHLSSAKTSSAAKTTIVATDQSNQCASNTLSQLILVSISARHLYACQGATQVYDSPVVTGISYLAADLTPPGTYHIYAKATDQTLRGCDSTGCWNDHVSYWMPFLDNQYGAYGFHDATWRTPDQFGNISPDSANASHGCVECPIATAQWLYNWASVGTTVTVVS